MKIEKMVVEGYDDEEVRSGSSHLKPRIKYRDFMHFVKRSAHYHNVALNNEY
jgi:hypothetical protein